MVSFNLPLGGGNGPADNHYDVIIIGGGPAGATAAIYAARANLRTLVIDKGLTAGALGLTQKIANYPGVPGEVTGADLLATMRQQAESFGATFVQDRVLSVNFAAEPREVWSGSGPYTARAVILATGSMGRAKGVKGEEEFLGRGVSYCATCDAAFYKGLEVAVAGGNDEAAEEALHLAKFAGKVHLLVPTPKLNVSGGLLHELEQSPAIEIHLGTRLREIVGDRLVTGVRIATREGAETILPVSGAFVYLQGGKPILDFLMGQLPMKEDGCVVVDSMYQTAIPGVFAVGDLLCNHIKQAVVAAADGAIAAMGVDRYLSGRATVRPDWA